MMTRNPEKKQKKHSLVTKVIWMRSKDAGLEVCIPGQNLSLGSLSGVEAF